MSLYDAIRATAPDTPIVVVGLLWPTDPPSSATSLRNAIRAEAEKTPRTFYIDTAGLRYPTGDDSRPTSDGYRDITVWMEKVLEDAKVAAPA